MAKCFVTGVEIGSEEAYVLDAYQARLLLRDIKQRAASLQRLLDQLSAVDKLELPQQGQNKKSVLHHRRFVSGGVADALSRAFPERKILVPWSEWRARRQAALAARSARKTPEAGAKESPDNGVCEASAE